MKQNHHFTGLTDAQVIESRQKYGANVLTPPTEESMWDKVKDCMHFWLLKVDLAIFVIAVLAQLSFLVQGSTLTKDCGLHQYFLLTSLH